MKIEKDDDYGFMISVPQNWVRVRPPIKRVMSDEQKAAMSERMKQIKNNKEKNR